MQPLYKVKFRRKPKLFSTICRANLVGDVNVNATKTYSSVKFKDEQKYRILPGECELHDFRCDISDTFKRMVHEVDINADKDDNNGDSRTVTKNDQVLKKYGEKIVGNTSSAVNPVIVVSIVHVFKKLLV